MHGRTSDLIAATGLPNGPSLPLVSIIVINFNYARFIGDTIKSIRVQRYPSFEVVIVDNASNDESLKVIEKHVDGDTRFRVIRMDRNALAMNAFLRGLDETTGDFVSAIDADDYLLEGYLSAHVQTHLAASPGVAFTSSNVFEVSERNEILCGRRSPHSQPRASSDHTIVARSHAPQVPEIGAADYEMLKESVRFYSPRTNGWLWAPGTSNVYRRSILDVVKPTAGSEQSEILSVDGYFCYACHWIAGSALIDKPYSAYRIHSQNFYSTMPSLTGVRKAAGPAASRLPLRRRYTIDAILRNVAKIEPCVGASSFWRLVDQAIANLNIPIQVELRDKEFLKVFATTLTGLIETLGRGRTLKELSLRLPARHLVEIARLSGEPLSTRTKWTLLRYRMKQKFGRRFGK